MRLSFLICLQFCLLAGACNVKRDSYGRLIERCGYGGGGPDNDYVTTTEWITEKETETPDQSTENVQATDEKSTKIIETKTALVTVTFTPAMTVAPPPPKTEDPPLKTQNPPPPVTSTSVSLPPPPPPSTSSSPALPASTKVSNSTAPPEMSTSSVASVATSKSIKQLENNRVFTAYSTTLISAGKGTTDDITVGFFFIAIFTAIFNMR